MWCPMDIRDYERRSHDRVSVCMLHEREFKSATLCCLRYMALVASRNTTLSLLDVIYSVKKDFVLEIAG